MVVAGRHFLSSQEIDSSKRAAWIPRPVFGEGNWLAFGPPLHMSPSPIDSWMLALARSQRHHRLSQFYSVAKVKFFPQQLKALGSQPRWAPGWSGAAPR